MHILITQNGGSYEYEETYLITSPTHFLQYPFNPKIFLGVVTKPNYNNVFPGAFREIAFIS